MTVATNPMIKLALWETGCQGKPSDILEIRLQG